MMASDVLRYVDGLKMIPCASCKSDLIETRINHKNHRAEIICRNCGRGVFSKISYAEDKNGIPLGWTTELIAMIDAIHAWEGMER